ncbi:hypothetical protein B296_00003284 [Ensete ventricosum]|uniref:Uncharacterized protein n=1 Tax=Ensete ventricosum TaxID=4639 RepID=A0A427B090_ENSVE|nr:hypothetical protein B296_00003284 [Ensete ventricosum]
MKTSQEMLVSQRSSPTPSNFLVFLSTSRATPTSPAPSALPLGATCLFFLHSITEKMMHTLPTKEGACDSILYQKQPMRTRMRKLTTRKRRRMIQNERTSSMGSLWPLAPDLLTALMESFGDRHHGSGLVASV